LNYRAPVCDATHWTGYDDGSLSREGLELLHQAAVRVEELKRFLTAAASSSVMAASSGEAAIASTALARNSRVVQKRFPLSAAIRFAARDARFALAATKAVFGAEAREAYTAAKGMSRTLKGAALVTHVQAMKRGARFSHGRPKQKGGGTQPMQRQM
jgi:hypothetical protein